MPTWCFKVATEPEEFRQIQALNYRTFVEEIPQHHPNPDGLLRDRFEAESVYCICLLDHQLAGMLALRSKRPFSLDQKLPDLDSHLPPHDSACEIRLLAIDHRHRHGHILTGLLGMVVRYTEQRGHDIALISGTLRQTRLYQHLGFTAFGPVVGTPEAPYQPMYQYVKSFRDRAAGMPDSPLAGLVRSEVNLMPGPVFPSPAVQAALAAKPCSHRSDFFMPLLEQTRRQLTELTGAEQAAIALGSGTLANDIVACQLSQLPGSGLVLSNGEFGRRLVDHATRLGLQFTTVEAPWGDSFDEPTLVRALSKGGPTTWIWAVHAETSTGVLNDIACLKRLAQQHGCRLALDCVSSLGIVETDLRDVFLASGVSGKGLRSMAGLALILSSGPLPDRIRPLPRYLDLHLYQGRTVPFTMPSNLLNALHIALEQLQPGTRYATARETAAWLCSEFRGMGLPPLADPALQFPGAITLPLPKTLDSNTLGAALENQGWLLSYKSGYLQDRNWIQVCPLCGQMPATLAPLLGAVREQVTPESPGSERPSS